MRTSSNIQIYLILNTDFFLLFLSRDTRYTYILVPYYILNFRRLILNNQPLYIKRLVGVSLLNRGGTVVCLHFNLSKNFMLRMNWHFVIVSHYFLHLCHRHQFLRRKKKSEPFHNRSL